MDTSMDGMTLLVLLAFIVILAQWWEDRNTRR
jgi:hypothetical protein